MKINTKEFTRELEWVARFIEKKTTIPILNNVMLRSTAGRLEMTGTDLEIAGVSSVEISGKPFAMTLPVALLLKYLKRIDDDTLDLEPRIVADQTYGPHVRGCTGSGHAGCCEPDRVLTAKLRVIHQDGQVEIDGTGIDNFPTVPDESGENVICGDVIGGIEKAVPRVVTSISKEESRFTLNGALLVIDKQARLVATDGHRLSVVDLDLMKRGEKKSAPIRLVLPKRTLIEAARCGDIASMARDENHVFLKFGHRAIVSRKLTGNFPDYERVLPDKFAFTVGITRDSLRKTLDRVAVFADERSRCVELTIEHEMKIAVRRDDRAASGRVDYTGPRFACPYLAAFNADYIGDFLKAISEREVAFRFNKASVAAQFEVSGWLYLLMPMRSGGSESDIPVVEGAYEPLPIAQVEPAPEPEPGPKAIATTSAPAMTGEHVDAMEAARLLGIYVATVYQRVKQGAFPEPVKVGRKMMWTRQQIEAIAA